MRGAALFELGQLRITDGAAVALRAKFESAEAPLGWLGKLIGRHARGDFGTIDAHDRAQNMHNIRAGFGQIMSVYNVGDLGAPLYIWIITEADRHATTILLPEEY